MSRAADDANGEDATDDGDENSADAGEGRRLKLAAEHPEQDEDGREILQDDGGGHGGALNGEVVEVVGGSDAEDAEDGAVADFAGANSELCAKSAKIGVSVPLVLWLRSLARCHARIAFREAKF